MVKSLVLGSQNSSEFRLSKVRLLNCVSSTDIDAGNGQISSSL